MSPRESAESKQSTSDSLAALLPNERSVEFERGAVVVRELTLAEMARLSGQFRPLVAAFTGAGGDPPRDIVDVVAQYESAAYAVAEASTGIAASTWRRAGAAKLARVVQAAVEENLDFFVRCVELAITLGAMQPTAPNGLGRTLSDTSSDAGIAPP